MMLGSGMNLITTIIGFGMSATFIVFVCTRLICGRLRRMESTHMLEIDSRLNFEMQPEYRINGLEPVIVDAIPTMKYNREAFSAMEDTQCVICLGEYEEKEVLRIMPKCGHSFHLSCIDEWLSKQSTCPVCRLPVQTQHVHDPVLSNNEVTGGDVSVEWPLPETSDASSITINVDVGVSGAVPEPARS